MYVCIYDICIIYHREVEATSHLYMHRQVFTMLLNKYVLLKCVCVCLLIAIDL